MNHYKKRDARELDPFFGEHMQAMTAEALYDKADIALELAFRDKRIAALEAELEQLGDGRPSESTRLLEDNLQRRIRELEAERDNALRIIESVTKTCKGLEAELAEAHELRKDYQSESESCFNLAQKVDASNPELEGAFTGPPSSRLERQFASIQAELAAANARCDTLSSLWEKNRKYYENEPCQCRFDENDKQVAKCFLHSEMEKELVAAKAENEGLKGLLDHRHEQSTLHG